MNNQFLLKKIKKLEKVFSPNEREPIIVEMWFPLMESDDDEEKALYKAEREYCEGKEIVCIPYGTLDKFVKSLKT